MYSVQHIYMKKVYSIRISTIVLCFRLEHNLAVSNHVFHLKPQVKTDKSSESVQVCPVSQFERKQWIRESVTRDSVSRQVHLKNLIFSFLPFPFFSRFWFSPLIQFFKEIHQTLIFIHGIGPPYVYNIYDVGSPETLFSMTYVRRSTR